MKLRHAIIVHFFPYFRLMVCRFGNILSDVNTVNFSFKYTKTPDKQTNRKTNKHEYKKPLGY